MLVCNHAVILACLLARAQSDLVKVHVGDASTPPHEVQRLLHVGRKAHGLVAWGRELILLDSEAAVLVSLDPATQAVYDLWHVRAMHGQQLQSNALACAHPECRQSASHICMPRAPCDAAACMTQSMHAPLTQVPEEGKFLKGLAVLDDVAYFGITTWAERSVRDSPDAHGELAAYDLVKGRLLWRRVVRAWLLLLLCMQAWCIECAQVASIKHMHVYARATGGNGRAAQHHRGTTLGS